MLVPLKYSIKSGTLGNESGEVMQIKLEINGQWQEVMPQQLKAMAQQGTIKPDTLVEFDGTIVPASRIGNLFQQQAAEGVPPNNMAATQASESLGSTTSEQGQTFNLETFFKVVSKAAAIFIKVIGVLVATLVIAILFLATKIKNLPWKQFIAKGKAMMPKLWQYRKAIAIGLCVCLLIFNLWGYGKRNTEEVTENTTTTQAPSPSQLQPTEEVVELNFKGKAPSSRQLTSTEWSTILTTKSPISLDLSYTTINDDDLMHLAGLNIQSLKLSDCYKITDVGLAHIKGMTQLQSLDLYGCEKITDSGLTHLKDMAQLQTLNLRSCDQITNTGLESLQKQLTNCSITSNDVKNIQTSSLILSSEKERKTVEVSKNIPVSTLQPLAEQGNVEAQFFLGFCYYNGDGVSQNYTQAVEWYTRAAEQGHAKAQHNLGLCYAKSVGVSRNYTKAMEWWTKAAEQELAEAQCNLGTGYYNGRGVVQSYTKAVEWFAKAAEQGHADSQYRLGGCYFLGEGVPQSYTKAAEWLTKAAKQGHTNATIMLEAIRDTR